MKNEGTLSDPRPDDPPQYNSHFVPGPPEPAVPPPAGEPGGLPMGYYSPQQPSTFPLGQPTDPIQYPPGEYPVLNQPVAGVWMPGPPPVPNCPPGLEYLTQLDNIHVFQYYDPLEMTTNFVANNRYDVKNNQNQVIYIVNEDSDSCTRNTCPSLRPFVLRVTDGTEQEIMTMQRPCRCSCCCCCCPSARQEMEVQCPPGVTLGFVSEDWSLCRAVYSIQNEKKENEMRVRGPCMESGSVTVYEVTSPDGVSHIGSIIRKWRGMLSETRDADHFDIQFPLDLDVKMKAMILGACFLIDFMYYDSPPFPRSSK
ncbi:phospholipid scramblase 4-like [Otolemur garnettii]|uniref:phospholipid scramblase 4-like n=1 Tax=Otolemur garnettii TaxID=30611 RepID=UPI000643FCBA|nr:phospholipid scramblase 4-like [Otolemur garnettii]